MQILLAKAECSVNRMLGVSIAAFASLMPLSSAGLRSCTLINSPLATNVTGQMKDILTTSLGMVLFQGVLSCAWAWLQFAVIC